MLQVVKDPKEEDDFPSAILPDRSEFEIGESVAVYGYYDHGESTTIANTSPRSGLLTTGVISTVFPIPVDGKTTICSRLVLDITAGPGSSGSPIFEPNTGQVVGMISQAKMRVALSPSAESMKQWQSESEEKNASEIKVMLTRVPMGIADTEPTTMMKDWLEKNVK